MSNIKQRIQEQVRETCIRPTMDIMCNPDIFNLDDVWNDITREVLNKVLNEISVFNNLSENLNHR